MSNIFCVIGCNSFSGSSIISYLLEKGNIVHGFSRSAENHKVFLPYKWDKYNYKNFNFNKLDINSNYIKLVDEIQKIKPDYILNFAAQGMVAESWITPEDWYNTNLLSQVKFIEKIKNFKFIKKFIQFTTPEVYGNTVGWIDENQKFNPTTPYAVSRAAFDFHLKNICEAYKFPVIFTRAANVYGPGQQLYRIVPRTLMSIKLKEKFPLHGNGVSERSFIHIKDVADAIQKIVDNGEIGSTYHISTDKIISIHALVEKMCLMLGCDIKEITEVVSERLGKDQTYSLSSQKLINNLGWKPKINLEDGLIEVINWINNYIDILKTQPKVYRHKK